MVAEPSSLQLTSTQLEEGAEGINLAPIDSVTLPVSRQLSSESTKTSRIVTFDGPNDPYNPLNWPLKRKILTTFLYGVTTAGSTWASSIYSPAITPIAEEFGVGKEVSTLGLTLFLFGFGVGPLLWAPLSEVYGRKVAVLPPYFISACFCFGTATAKDIQTVLITRFFTGFFSSAPVTNTGGVLGDVWTPKMRGIAILAYSMSVVGGPLFSPVVGAAIVQSYLGWRWTHYLTGIMMMSIIALDILFVQESYGKVLLVKKAQRLRHKTGDWNQHALHEEWEVSFKELTRKFLIRPFQLLLTPICFFMVIYVSFVYGIVYLNLGAFGIEYGEVRGWKPVAASLPLIAIFVGCYIGTIMSYLNNRFYIRKFKLNNNKAVPEARLPPMIAGSFSLVAGLFIFAWTSSPDIHWIGSCVGAALMGFGFFGIFQGATNYLVDTFQEYGASAIAANTLIRNIFAGSFPLFTDQMFHAMGVNWATSLLGFIAVAMIPIPLIFYFFGKRIRARGKWSVKSTL